MSTATKVQGINLAEVEVGDIFSEQSHYVLKEKDIIKGTFLLEHLESGRTVKLDGSYVSNLLDTADQFDENKQVEVGKEDKLWTAKQIDEAVKKGELKADHNVRVGDLRQKGIRSIWADIHSQQVFTVNFNKQNTELSDKALLTAKENQLKDALAKIEKAQKNKEGVLKIATEVVKDLQENPILPIVKGDERTLRGYKTQFESINGTYNVVDMDITNGNKQRQVNVNQINWLVYNGVKYLVK